MKQNETALETSLAASQHLTFTLGAEEYGIEILAVQEIKGYAGVTPIPNTPPYMRGVMNLRGAVVPVVDLRIRFGMPEQEYNKFTVIIVVRLHDKAFGLIVDAVSDVLDVAPADLRETPDLGVRADLQFISGMAAIGEKFVVLLDISRLVADEELRIAA